MSDRGRATRAGSVRSRAMSEPIIEVKRSAKKKAPPAPKAKPTDNRPEVVVQKTAAAARKLAQAEQPHRSAANDGRSLRRPA